MNPFIAVPGLGDFALLVLRLTIGLMFAMSGFFKLTTTDRRDKMRDSLSQAGVPAGLAPLVSSGELIGGVSVVLGFVTAAGSAVLFIISLGALVTMSIPKAEGEGIHKLENILYMPEALLTAALLVLTATGPGAWSLDALLLR